MTKKILIGLFLLLATVIIIFSYSFYKNVKAPISTNTIAAIPQNAAIIIQETNFKKFYAKITSSSIIWQELLDNTENIKQINNQLHFFDSLATNQKLAQLIKNQPITASLHLAGANNFNFVFYIPTITNIDENKFIQEVKTLTKSNPETRVYENVTIYNFPIEGKQKISLIYRNNIVSFSYSTILIEDVIRQLSADNSLLDNYSFNKTINTSGEVEDGNIFINHKYFQKLPNLFLNASLKDYTKSFENYAIWSAVDATLKNNSITLNGFTLATDSSNNYLSLFKHQKPQEIEILNSIPNNTAFLFYYSFSNAKQFFTDRKTLLKSKNQFFNYQKYLDQQTETYGIDLEEEFLSYIGNEISFVITEPVSENYTNEKFVVIHVNDIEKATQSLNNIAAKTNPEFTIIESNEHRINQIGIDKLFSTLFGKPFYNINQPYFTLIGDYVVFGASESAIQTYINKIELEKTLDNDENFKSFKDNLSSSASLFIYNNIARSVNLYPHFLAADYAKNTLEKIELLRKFEAVGLQISANKNDLYYNNIYLKYNPVYKQDTRTVWETKLDTIVKTKPQIVVNHVNNTKEIIVQDLSNKIYLISNTGKILWTKQLSEKIIGKIHQVDVYKNNKLQYLFNTENKIYLLDRNGNNVEQYPIKLKATATNGITPLDYNNNKNYRLLIGCSNNMVYNYDITGNIVSGWEYEPANGYANSAIWHFAINNKDYIVIPLNNGEVKIVERAGKIRVKLTNKLPVNSNTIHLTTNNDLKNCYLTTIDTLGNIAKLYLNDKLENIHIADIPKNTFFEHSNINNDIKNEYVFAFENVLKVFDSEKNKLFEVETLDPITESPLFFKMPDKSKKIGIVTSTNIYLFNEAGIVQDNFPLAGSTLFSISDLNNDNTTNLVVADKDILYMYNLE
ncbi:MAG: hypothetical protein H6587_09230 [Flavobacteriales bacterium]|nr:hypothetical protein [Flavobacteriales bacterium]MCB9364738.1 hypothetical protein [Flavobacteriales bacterium]